MNIHRRHFLKQAGAVGLGFTGLYNFLGFQKSSQASPSAPPYGFGPLRSDPNSIIDLPEGFSYQVISRFGDVMDDGLRVPHRPDGMATFPGPNGRTLLVRNHEVSSGAPLSEGAFGPGNELRGQITDDRFYDAGKNSYPALGGTTTVVYNTQTQQIEQQHLSLAGTIRNCAGGPTPWNSWITCEESVQKANDVYAQNHGYCFEVPAQAEPSLADPVPLKEMGRFNHEAVAVDPKSGVVYLTEDRHEGLIYRYIPHTPGQLHKGGRLQALVIQEQQSFDTRNWEQQAVSPGDTLSVSWMDLEHTDAPEDDLRFRGFENGAARFARGEGMWYGEGAVYFACTNGGEIKKGQIWRYTPSIHEGSSGEKNQPGQLELFVEPNDGTLIRNADNITIAPWGDIVVCEDNSDQQSLDGITSDGEFYKLARNSTYNSEFAGATFSPDGSTLFVNVQHEGLTLAITGPWQQRG